MSRSMFSFRRTFAAFALVIGLALGVGSCDSIQPQPGSIPVTGGLSAVRGLGGSSNSVTGPDQSLIFSGRPAQYMDTDIGLGTTFRLETNAQGVQVVPAKKAAGQGYLTYRLGAGYRLGIASGGGMIILPTDVLTGDQQVDLGGGYTLAIHGKYGRVIPPGAAASLSPIPHDPNVSVQSIGGGFWLVIDPNGNWIWQE